MSQTDTVLWMLRRGWVCGTEFLDARIPRYSARIDDLKARGYGFERRACKRHPHKSRQWEWRLLSEVAADGQEVWHVA